MSCSTHYRPIYYLGAWYIPATNPAKRTALPHPVLSAMADGYTVVHYGGCHALTADEALAAYQHGLALILS